MKYLRYLLTACLFSSCSYVREKMKERQIKTWNERVASAHEAFIKDSLLLNKPANDFHSKAPLRPVNRKFVPAQ